MSTLTRRLQQALVNHKSSSIYDSNRWFSSEEVLEVRDRIVALLAATEVQPGQRVVLGYPNSYAFLVTYLALLEYGAVIVPVNPKMPVPELHRSLIRSNATTAFFTETQWAEFRTDPLFVELNETTALPLDTVLTTRADESLPATTYVWEESQWTAKTPVFPSETPKIDEPADDAVGVILYTSGTTGKPKAVGLQHKHLLATANNVIASHGLTAADTTYCFLPLFHINAQVVAFLSTVLSGGRIVVSARFSASRFWPTIAKHDITWVSAVPTILAILLNAQTPPDVPSTLRFFRSASAQLPQINAKRFETKFGIPVIQSYGMTEAASQICVNPLPPEERKLGSVGLPSGVELKITGDSDEALQPGEVGEIAIRGEGVVDYYEEAESQKDFRQGWFFTGDLGYMDKDGYVYITGRKKEMINRAGEKVSPYEVEDVIRQFPNVDEVAVIGLPDTMYGERVAAYVTVRRTPPDQNQFVKQLMEHCASAISRYKCPSEIHVVETIPVGATGKIQRTVLKSKVLAAAGMV